MNDIYKKLRILAKTIGAEDSDIFSAGGLDVSKSQLQAWRVGEGHKNYRKIKDYQLLAYIDGLVIYHQGEHLKHQQPD